MTVKYITVIDLTVERDEGRHRQMSLAMYDTDPGVLQVVGNLPHCTQLTFDKENAAKMIAFCEGILNE